MRVPLQWLLITVLLMLVKVWGEPGVFPPDPTGTGFLPRMEPVLCREAQNVSLHQDTLLTGVSLLGGWSLAQGRLFHRNTLHRKHLLLHSVPTTQ